MTIKTQFAKIKENWLIAVLLIVLIAIPFFSGGVSRSFGSMQESYAMNDMGYGAPMMKASSMYYGGDFAPEVEERKITKNAHMSLEIERDNFEQQVSQLKTLLEGKEALLLNENIRVNKYGDSEYRTADFTIKVPVASYDSLISEMLSLGDKNSFNENSNDITASFENAEIELGVEQEKLRRYQELYDASKDTEDKITLTDRIFQQERTIKYLQERIDNLDKKVDYSTVSLSLVEEKSNYAFIDFIDLSEIADTSVKSLNNMIILVLKILPYAILILIGLLIAKKRKCCMISKKRK